MRRLSSLLTVVLMLTSLTGLARAQEADDWIFRDEGDGVVMAAVGYEDGRSLIVQCRDARLTTALVGWPVNGWLSQHPGGPHFLKAIHMRTDGRQDRGTWLGRRENVLASAWPARTARFLRTSGAVTLRVEGGEGRNVVLDLPSAWANLDRVLTACDQPLDEPRDLLPNVLDLLEVSPAARMPSTNDVGTAMVSCIVSETMRLHDCRAEEVTPTGTGLTRSAPTAFEGLEVQASDRAAVVGGVVLMSITTQLFSRPSREQRSPRR